MELRSLHDKGEIWAGVNVLEGKTGNMLNADVIEPLAVKMQAIKSATEATSMILRIDDVIASAKTAGGAGPKMPQQSGMGMGED